MFPGLTLAHWLTVHGLVTVIYIASFMIKTVILLWLTLMIRWSLPRFRYDQVMKMCWRYMLPLSLMNIFVTGLVILFTSR